MSYKVIQWATGGVGRAALECILDHPELELVGCWVHSTEKHGVDAGVLAGRAADPIWVSPLLSKSSFVQGANPDRTGLLPF